MNLMFKKFFAAAAIATLGALAPATLSAATDSEPVTLWEGQTVTGKWGKRVKITADKLTEVEAMSKLIVEFTVAEGAEHGQLDIKDADQKSIKETTATASGTQGGYFMPGTTESTFIVIPGDLEKVRGGIYVYGNSVVITAVKLGGIADESELPGGGGSQGGGQGGDMPGTITAGDGTVTWEGEVNLGTDWTTVLQIKPANFREVLGNGSTMVIDFTVNADDTYGKFEIDYGNYEKAAETDASRTGADADGNFASDATTTTFTVADAEVANFNRRGLIVKGYNITLRKIVFTKGENAGQGGGHGGGGNQGGGNQGGSQSGSVSGTEDWDANGYLWTGTAVFSSDWSTSLEIAADRLAFVKAGTEMKVDFAVQNGASYGKFEVDYFDWSRAAATDETATGLDDYGCFQPGATTTTFTIAAADADRFRTEGMRLKGTGLTVTRLLIGETPAGNAGIESATENADAPVEYYDLHGTLVSTDETPEIPGIYIRRCGGKTSKVATGAAR